MKKLIAVLAAALLVAGGVAYAQNASIGPGPVVGVTSFTAGTTGLTPSSATAGAITLAGVLGVANGGDNCSVASITCFNNITGFTAAGTTGTTSTNLVFSTSPSLVTPALGVATGTSLALGGATIGTDALGVTGTTTLGGATAINNTAGSGSTLAIQHNGSLVFNVRYDGYLSNLFAASIGAFGLGNLGAGVFNMDSNAFVFEGGTSNDVIITRRAAANWNFGAADDASPVAQTLSFQGVNAGTTSNGASPNTTIVGSLGTGTGTNGDMIFQTGVQTTTGSVAATPTTALTLKGETQAAIFTGNPYLLASAFTTAGCTALTVTVTTGAIGCTASDERLKNDQGILDPQEALAFANAADVHFYDFKHIDSPYVDGSEHIGLFAQNVNAVAPHIASAMVRKMAPTSLTPDGTFSIDYAQSGPVALAAVKALSAQHEADAAKIAKLEERLSRMEAMWEHAPTLTPTQNTHADNDNCHFGGLPCMLLAAIGWK